jgi:hypothetical protein
VPAGSIQNPRNNIGISAYIASIKTISTPSYDTVTIEVERVLDCAVLVVRGISGVLSL